MTRDAMLLALRGRLMRTKCEGSSPGFRVQTPSEMEKGGSIFYRRTKRGGQSTPEVARLRETPYPASQCTTLPRWITSNSTCPRP